MAELWNDQAALLLVPGANRGRQDAVDGADFAAEGEFADDGEVFEVLGNDLLADGEDSDGDGKIETRPFLLHVGGREIDGGAAEDVFEAAVFDGGLDAVAGFLDRRVGQPDNDDRRQSPPCINFDFDRIGIDTEDRCGVNLSEHPQLITKPIVQVE